MFYQKEKVHIMYIADSPVITKKTRYTCLPLHTHTFCTPKQE